MKVITKSPENVSEFVKLSGTDGDAALQQVRKLVSTLYDQQGKEYNYHHDLNKLRTRIAKQKDISLSEILPCKASFPQHVKLAHGKSGYGKQHMLGLLIWLHLLILAGYKRKVCYP